MPESLANWRTRRQLAKTAQQIARASYSAATWRFETRDLIRDEIESFLPKMQVQASRSQIADNRPTLQYELHSNDVLPAQAGTRLPVPEGPAAIVYSLNPNGSIAVLGYPHGSAVSAVMTAGEGDTHFVLDLLPDARCLAGQAGRSLVREHVRRIIRLSCVSRARALPSKSSGKFLEALTRRTQEFRMTFGSADEARRHRLIQEANLGIGLIAGLIASSIFPFAKDFGQERAQKARETAEQCLAGPSEGVSKCLKSHLYAVDHDIGVTLSTGPLLLFALGLTLVSLFIVWRITKRR